MFGGIIFTMVDLEEMWSVPKREKGIDEVGEITLFSLSFCWVSLW